MFSPEERDEMDARNARAKTPEGRYGLGKRIEYRVKPVTRFIVTRYCRDIEPPEMGSSGGPGAQVTANGAEYDTEETAYAVAYALCSEEHRQLGYPAFDDRVQYPIPVGSSDAVAADS